MLQFNQGLTIMKIALWALSCVLLLGASITGIGASIGAIGVEWFVVCLLCVTGMFSAAGWADKWELEG